MKVFIIILFLINFQNSHLQIVEPPTNDGVTLNEILEAGFDMEDFQSMMQGDLEDLQDKMDNLKKRDVKKFEKLLIFINENRKRQELLNRNLAASCGDVIAKGEFDRAGDLLKFVFTSNYDEVIYRSYKSNSINFGKIMDFANFVDKENDDKTLFLYQELFKQSTINASSSDLMSMATFILNRYNIYKWNDLKKNVLNSLVSKASAEILGYLNIEVEKIDRKSYDLIDQVNELNHDAGLQLVSEIVQQLWKNDIQKWRIRKFLSQCLNLPLRVQGFSTLYDFQKHDELNYKYVFSLTVDLGKTFREPEIDEETKNKVTALAENIPSPIRGAVYSASLCIQNKMTNNYLKVAKLGNRNIYLSKGDPTTDRLKWQFYFQNLDIIVFSMKNFQSKQFVFDESYYSIECHDSSEGFYFKLANDQKYLRDDEGQLKYSVAKDEFSKWILKACSK